MISIHIDNPGYGGVCVCVWVWVCVVVKVGGLLWWINENLQKLIRFDGRMMRGGGVNGRSVSVIRDTMRRGDGIEWVPLFLKQKGNLNNTRLTCPRFIKKEKAKMGNSTILVTSNEPENNGNNGYEVTLLALAGMCGSRTTFVWTHPKSELF